jgi:hypothetical protein
MPRDLIGLPADTAAVKVRKFECLVSVFAVAAACSEHRISRDEFRWSDRACAARENQCCPGEAKKQTRW